MIAQGPPLLESEWTAETGFRIREDTGSWGLEGGELMGPWPTLGGE